jgi:hypothetical protein
VIKKIFDSVDEISREAVKLLTSLPAKSGSSSPVPSIKKVNGHNGEHRLLNGDLSNPHSDSSNELQALTNGFDNLKVGADNEYEGLQVGFC